MHVIKLTLIDGNEPIFIVAEHITCVGVAYTVPTQVMTNIRGKGKKVGTIVNLVSGVNHGVVETPEKVISLMHGHLQ